MPTKVNLISGFFILEIDSWKESLSFYVGETATLEQWLMKLLQFDTVPDLANKVENYISKLRMASSRMNRMLSQLEKFEEGLQEEEEPIDNDKISDSLRKGQNEYRSEVRRVERDYLDLKNECDIFVADSLIIQNSPPANGH